MIHVYYLKIILQMCTRYCSPCNIKCMLHVLNYRVLKFTMIYRRLHDSREKFTGHAHWHHQCLFIHTTAYKRPADEDCGLHFQGRK